MIGEVYGLLDQSVFVFVPRRRGGGRQERHDDLSISVGGAGIDALLLDGKRFHPRAF